MRWQLAEAKNKFSEVMTKALTAGPQRVSRRDQTVVVLAEADYLRLTGEHTTLKDFLLAAPDLSDLDLTRDASPMREVAWLGCCSIPACSLSCRGLRETPPYERESRSSMPSDCF